VLARLVLLAVAAVVVVAGVRAVHRQDGCAALGRAAIHKGFGEPLGDGPGLVRDIERSCSGAHPLVAAADALEQGRHLREASALAGEAVRREPESAEGWAVLSNVLRLRGLAADAARAQARAHTLNPRGVPAPPRA
jgi:hypothetical protein